MATVVLPDVVSFLLRITHTHTHTHTFQSTQILANVVHGKLCANVNKVTCITHTHTVVVQWKHTIVCSWRITTCNRHVHLSFSRKWRCRTSFINSLIYMRIKHICRCAEILCVPTTKMRRKHMKPSRKCVRNWGTNTHGRHASLVADTRAHSGLLMGAFTKHANAGVLCYACTRRCMLLWYATYLHGNAHLWLVAFRPCRNSHLKRTCYILTVRVRKRLFSRQCRRPFARNRILYTWCYPCLQIRDSHDAIHACRFVTPAQYKTLQTLYTDQAPSAGQSCIACLALNFGSLCICLSICLSVCLYVCIYVGVYIYICIWYICICMYTYVGVYIYLVSYICICMYVCINMYMYVCVYVCVHVYIYIYNIHS